MLLDCDPGPQDVLLDALEHPNQPICRSIVRQVRRLQAGGAGMETHAYRNPEGLGIAKKLPGNVLQSYISMSEGAWRILWQRDQTTLYVYRIGPHPN